MYNIYCYALALSALVSFFSLIYLSMTRPFKSPIHNIMIIFDEFMMLACFIVLFRYANFASVVDKATSEAYAKLFSLLVFILTIVPAILTFIEFLRSLKYFRKICNWKRDYEEEKDTFDSSIEEMK